jgi:hypothetical protein
MHSDTPVPDITGADLGDRTNDPVAEARALASALEAENGERINKLLALGASPLSLQISAIQIRVEELIELLPLPALLKAQFEVSYEAAMAEMLDTAYQQASGPRLYTPGAE